MRRPDEPVCTLVIFPHPSSKSHPVLSWDMTDDCFYIASRLMFLASPLPDHNLSHTS
jgi:hypothetical protein